MAHTRLASLRCVALAALAFVAAVGCSPEYPKCESDEDCHKGEFCVDQLCQQCRGSEDCPAGQQCASGACEAISGYCTSASQCGPGQDCQNNVCVTAMQSDLGAASDTGATSTVGQCELMPVYFGFDESTLSDSARSELSSVASCIRERNLRGVHLTGLTDPRGTEEYNLALGDRRAQTAQQYLKSLAVEADVSYSSMGEELSTGTDEGSWAKDRRVDVRAK